MALSNIVALFIVITTAATLNAHHVTDIQTSSQAASALQAHRRSNSPSSSSPLGIVGCGLLAVPVLAGSARSTRLARSPRLARPRPARKFRRAKAFYGAIIAACVIGAALNFVHIDPIKALFWSAVINGVAAVPIMAMIMRLATRRTVMGDFKLPWGLATLGWLATAVMAVAAVGMFATMGG